MRTAEFKGQYMKTLRVDTHCLNPGVPAPFKHGRYVYFFFMPSAALMLAGAFLDAGELALGLDVVSR